MSEKLRAHILVNGKVQGVFFRQNTKNKAREVGVFGFVRNLPDGGVEAVFEGDKEKVEEMLKWTKEGPDYAQVDGHKINFEEYKGEFDSFEIRH